MWGKRESLIAKVQGSRGGFAAIDEEVAAVLAFVISHTTLLVAQDDETGRCPKVCGEQVSRFELYKHRPQGRE